MRETCGNSQRVGDNADGRRKNPQLAVVFLQPVAGQRSQASGREAYAQLASSRRRHQRVPLNAVVIGKAMLSHLHIEDGHTQVQSVEKEESSTRGSGKSIFWRH